MNGENVLSEKQTRELAKERFAKMVGWTAIKEQILMLLLSARISGFFPNLLFIAPAGLGKTRFLRIVASLVKDVLDRDGIWFDRGLDMGTRLEFTEKVLVPKVNDQHAVLASDEVHEWKAPVQALIRTMIEPTAERRIKSVRACGDYDIIVDPKKFTFLAATNKVEKLDAPTLSRFHVIYPPLYTDNEMEAILTLAFKNSPIKFAGKAKHNLATNNRGTARDIVLWFDTTTAYAEANGKKTLTENDVAEITRLRDCFPLGVTGNELKTLLYLELDGELQLKQLAARNVVTSQEQNANERYLLQRGLIRIDGCRQLTQAGIEYLKGIREAKFKTDGLINKPKKMDAGAAKANSGKGKK